MSKSTNFLGIPIEGHINHASARSAQRPLSELEPLLRAVLVDLAVVEFGWAQYTPYFNDGEPCVFSVGELWFRTTADSDTDSEELYLSFHPGLRAERWDNESRRMVPVERDPETVARYDRCKALADAIGSGAFDDVLLEAFGDHAEVTVRRTGIVVDTYDHD